MSKTFYTERDIDDLLRQGVKSLIVDDDVVLTDLAYERARRMGVELLRTSDQPPGAPVRPYIAKLASPSTSAVRSPIAVIPTPLAASAETGQTPAESPLFQRIYDASLARLGGSVDPKLLESIIHRVLSTLGSR